MDPDTPLLSRQRPDPKRRDLHQHSQLGPVQRGRICRWIGASGGSASWAQRSPTHADCPLARPCRLHSTGRVASRYGGPGDRCLVALSFDDKFRELPSRPDPPTDCPDHRLYEPVCQGHGVAAKFERWVVRVRCHRGHGTNPRGTGRRAGHTPATRRPTRRRIQSLDEQQRECLSIVWEFQRREWFVVQ